MTCWARFKVDIWISTESTAAAGLDRADPRRRPALGLQRHDRRQAGRLLPLGRARRADRRGVDFGLDAVAASRNGDIRTLRFSTEILYRNEPAFTDGDVLKKGDGIEYLNGALVAPFEPNAKFLGVDALHILIPGRPSGPATCRGSSRDFR